ncbi:Protein of unknown function [Gryllus bimaculatus]|nr:Protein of unknown function [Gryllus bimaculatus]
MQRRPAWGGLAACAQPCGARQLEARVKPVPIALKNQRAVTGVGLPRGRCRGSPCAGTETGARVQRQPPIATQLCRPIGHVSSRSWSARHRNARLVAPWLCCAGVCPLASLEGRVRNAVDRKQELVGALAVCAVVPVGAGSCASTEAAERGPACMRAAGLMSRWSAGRLPRLACAPAWTRARGRAAPRRACVGRGATQLRRALGPRPRPSQPPTHESALHLETRYHWVKSVR